MRNHLKIHLFSKWCRRVIFIILEEKNDIFLHLRVCNRNFHIYTRIDGDGSNLLDGFRWWPQINDPLVDSHLEPVPCLGSFSARCLSCCDSQHLSWKSNRTIDVQLLISWSLDQLGADLFKVSNIGTGQGNSNSMNLSLSILNRLLRILDSSISSHGDEGLLSQ